MYSSSRELFEAARAASQDAETCREQLLGMESAALALQRPNFEAHVGGGGDHDHMAGRVAALVDTEERLRRRQDEDYALIDSACAVLYGREQDAHGGLCSIAPPWWADLLWWRYLAAETWATVAEIMGVSERHAHNVASSAFELLDSYGMAQTVDGMGVAED